MRCLFHCRNTTGLGHLIRGYNIAKAIHELAPEVEIIFAGNRSSVAADLLEFPYEPHLGTKRLIGLRPDIIVLDTLFPNWKIPDGIPTVYVMRRIREATLQIFLEHPLASRTDLVLIPHEEDEFVHQLPEWVREKAFWTGPIVRETNIQAQQNLRKKYEIQKTDFVVLSTAGGGGRTEESTFFFGIISAIHEPLRKALQNLRHFVAPGPYSRVTIPPQPQMSVLPLEPQMNDLIALSNVVIAEGGYNTVYEIRHAKVPALFIPSNRKHDNQEQRVRELEEKGFCAVFSRQSPRLARDILKLLQSQPTFDAMKSKLRDDHFQPGNRFAAEKILDLAKGVSPQKTKCAQRIK